MSDLRSRLIRLAAAKPELRADLLPLLQEQADPASVDQNKPESYYGLPPRGVQAARRREDPNRVVFKVSRQVDTGELTVHNMTGGKKYVLSAHGSDPQELAETLEASASASLRFQNMDTLDGMELNYVKAPRLPRQMAERLVTLATVIVGAHYVAVQGTSMGLEWKMLTGVPRMTG
jgi:hypothetical protein